MTKHQKTENLTLVPIDDADVAALAAEARELADDIRVGDDLRFTKGRWHKIVGKDDDDVGATTPFIVDVRNYWRGWIKWIDKAPVFKGFGRPIDGFVSPKRYELPDNDKSKWPREKNGAAKDPWQETFYLVMRDLGDMRLCTWTVTSYYGSKAIGALLKVYTREVKQHAGLMPVVLLSSEVKETVDYGNVDAPVLTIADWQGFGEGAAPAGMPNAPKPDFPKAQKAQEVLPPPPKKSIGDDMDDEIPF
jgi:hypothetical protein